MARRRHRILIASDDPVFADRLDDLFPDAELERCMSVAEAATAIATRPFAGAVLDARLPDRQATRLATVFLARQPAGRVVVACPDGDQTTLRDIVARDPRAELVFAPWEGTTLRDCLLAPVEMGAFTRPRRRPGRLSRLLRPK